MTISIWRYSHLTLAISSFIFITLASVTGIVLSFKPIIEKTQPYKASNFNQLNLAEVITTVKKNYPDVVELKVDDNQFVQVDASDSTGKSGQFYINPQSGKLLGKVKKESELFQWVTSLHRSLFLHETGRLVMGITAFLLMLIATSGTILVLQRQRSLKRFFAKIVKENFAQYYHVVLGRLMLIPILIISITGTYLCLTKFEYFTAPKITHKVDFDAIKSTPKKEISNFDSFKNISLSEVKSVEFPFSDDVEDYYTLKLTDRQTTVNQLTGETLTNIPYTKAAYFTNLSMDLHTGRSNLIWAIVLAIACVNILFFIYSGFAITLKRIANRTKNKFKADQCEFILLVGSENGNTFLFAKAIHQQLIEKGHKSYLTELNNYKVFARAKHLIIFTSTYGLGNAPSNANQFEKLVAKYPQPQKVDFSVVGFGSHAYPDFCKFAYEANNLLAQQTYANPLMEIHTVNDRSVEEFNLWVTTWSQLSGVSIDLPNNLLTQKKVKTQTFTVVSQKTSAETEPTFLLTLQPNKNVKFNSGDLLAIYPANDHRERFYSIGKVGNNIQLSVKLHENGLGSTFLNSLQRGNQLTAAIVPNPHFHFPKKASTVVMISNGTGIAPFLGMLSQYHEQTTCYLYCGFRNPEAFELYRNGISAHIADDKLKIAYSRTAQKQYVKDLLEVDQTFIADTLKSGGVLMICGSLNMQNDVIALLEKICQEHGQKSVSFYQSHGQILMDCY